MTPGPGRDPADSPTDACRSVRSDPRRRVQSNTREPHDPDRQPIAGRPGLAPARRAHRLGAAPVTGVGPPDESYRAVLDARTPEHGLCSLLVLRRGYGGGARVWVSLHGGIQATAVLDRDEVVRLRALLDEAAEGSQ